MHGSSLPEGALRPRVTVVLIVPSAPGAEVFPMPLHRSVPIDTNRC